MGDRSRRNDIYHFPEIISVPGRGELSARVEKGDGGWYWKVFEDRVLLEGGKQPALDDAISDACFCRSKVLGEWNASYLDRPIKNPDYWRGEDRAKSLLQEETNIQKGKSMARANQPRNPTRLGRAKL